MRPRRHGDAEGGPSFSAPPVPSGKAFAAPRQPVPRRFAMYSGRAPWLAWRPSAPLAEPYRRPRQGAAAAAPPRNRRHRRTPKGRFPSPQRLHRPRRAAPAERNLRIPRRARAPLSRRYSGPGRPGHWWAPGTSAVTKHSYCTRYPPHTLLSTTRTTKITHVDDPVDNVLRRTTRMWRRGGPVVEKTRSPQAGE